MKRIFENDSILEKIQQIEQEVLELMEENESFRKRLREYNAEKAYADLAKEYQQYRVNSFAMTSIEEKKVEQFKRKHLASCKNDYNFTYIFTPTAIHDFVDIRCNCCDEIEFLS